MISTVNYRTVTPNLIKVFFLLLATISTTISASEVFADAQNLAATIQSNGKYTSREQCLDCLQSITKERTKSFLKCYHELEQRYKSVANTYAPSRKIGEIRINCTPEDIRLVCNLIIAETKKRPIDWEILNAAVESLGRSQSNSNLVYALKRILRLPLTRESNTTSQISAIESSLCILAQQNSRRGLDLLMKCALLPIDPSPEILTASKELQGTPADLEILRRKIANFAATAVLEYAEKGSVLPFFKKLNVAASGDQQFKEEIEPYLDEATRIAAGDENPSDTPREER